MIRNLSNKGQNLGATELDRDVLWDYDATIASDVIRLATSCDKVLNSQDDPCFVVLLFVYFTMNIRLTCVINSAVAISENL